MTLKGFKDYCLSKKGAVSTYPHGDSSIWFKVKGKSFAWTFVQEFKYEGKMSAPFSFINLKCDPDHALELRASYESIIPGWHQNKKYWNSVFADARLDDELIKQMIDHSYNLIVSALPKKDQLDLNELTHAE